MNMLTKKSQESVSVDDENDDEKRVHQVESYFFTTIAVLSAIGIVGSRRDREVSCSALDRQGSNFESCVWRTVSSHSSHHPQEAFLAQFSLYVHKGGLKPDSFHFY